MKRSLLNCWPLILLYALLGAFVVGLAGACHSERPAVVTPAASVPAIAAATPPVRAATMPVVVPVVIATPATAPTVVPVKTPPTTATTSPATAPVTPVAIPTSSLEFFVSPAAGNDAAPGNKAFPLNTISEAFQRLAGKTGSVELLAGTYHLAATIAIPDNVSLDAADGVGTVVVTGDNRLATLLKAGRNSHITRISFQHANPATLQAGVEAASGAVFEDDDFSSSAESGLNIYKSDGVIVRRCTARSNGREGIKSGLATNLLLEDCTIEHNNAANFSAGGEAGGGKHAKGNSIIVRRCTYRANNGIGLWFDIDNKNITVDGCTFEDQQYTAAAVATDPKADPQHYMGIGLMVEISPGPATVKNCTFARNYCAVQIGESSNISITGCTISGPREYIDLRELPGRTYEAGLPASVGNITLAGNQWLNGSFLSTSVAGGEFAARGIRGSGNVITGSPAGYIGAGKPAIATAAALQKLTGVGVTAGVVSPAASPVPVTQPTPAPTSKPTTVPAPASASGQDDGGWTVPPVALHTYYIDGSNGDDRAAGTQAAPWKTTAPALREIVPGDAILFHTGSTNAPFSGWLSTSGIHVGAYGPLTASPDSRPIIQCANGAVGVHLSGANHCLLTDLRFVGDNSATGAPTKGIIVGGDGNRIEGCAITGFFQGLVVTAGDGTIAYRCNISHNYKIAGNGHAVGVYYFGDNTHTQLVQCVIDGNGWDGKNPATADEFQHGVYGNDGGATTAHPLNPADLIGSIVANNGGNGYMGRAGGTLDNDLFIDNGIHGQNGMTGGATGEIKNCVVTGAPDAPARDQQRGDGLFLDSLNGSMHDNLVLHSRGAAGSALGIASVAQNLLDMGTGTASIYGNKVIDWSGVGIAFQDKRAAVDFRDNAIAINRTPGNFNFAANYRVAPSAIHAARNSYSADGQFRINSGPIFTPVQWMGLIGETGGSAAAATDSPVSIEAYAASVGVAGAQAFLARAEANCRANWDARFTALKANDYFRNGVAGAATQPSH